MLNDDQKRAAYDQYGHAAFEQGGHGGGGHGGGRTLAMPSAIFSVIFLVAVVAAWRSASATWFRLTLQPRLKP